MSDADGLRPEDAPGRFAYEGLDRMIHERARLGLLTSLATHPDGLVFADLKQLCTLTDGNLSRHLQVLQEAGLVEIAKSFVQNRPQTFIRLTAEGRARYLAYLDELERVVRDAAAVAAAAGRPAAAAKAAGVDNDATAPPQRGMAVATEAGGLVPARAGS